MPVRGTGTFIRSQLPVLCSFRRLQKYPQHGVASGGYLQIARVRVTILLRIKQPTTTSVFGHCAGGHAARSARRAGTTCAPGGRSTRGDRCRCPGSTALSSSTVNPVCPEEWCCGEFPHMWEHPMGIVGLSSTLWVWTTKVCCNACGQSKGMYCWPPKNGGCRVAALIQQRTWTDGKAKNQVSSSHSLPMQPCALETLIRSQKIWRNLLISSDIPWPLGQGALKV